jgi:hypothetical protein
VVNHVFGDRSRTPLGEDPDGQADALLLRSSQLIDKVRTSA